LPDDAPLAVPKPVSKAGPVLAVLPFADLGGDPGQQYFSDGITRDITDRLTRFRAIRPPHRLS